MPLVDSTISDFQESVRVPLQRPKRPSKFMRLRFGCGGLRILLSLGFSSFCATVQIWQNFTESTFGTDSSALPADTTGVIGPNHFVELLNGRFAVYDRNTGQRVLS